MSQQLTRRVRQVPVTDPLAVGRRYDYADAFQVELPEPDQDTPEAWIRAGMSSTPALVDWIAARLGHQDASVPSPDRVEGFRVVRSSSEVLELEQSLALLDVVLIARRVGSSGRMFTSLLTYRRPVLARLVWAVLRYGHRWAARGLITSSSSGGGNGGDVGRAPDVRGGTPG